MIRRKCCGFGSNRKSLDPQTLKYLANKRVTTKKNDIPLVLAECLGVCDEFHHGRKISFSNDFYRWDATYHASLPDYVYHRITCSKNAIKLADIAIIVNARADPRRSDGTFRYIEISDVDSTSGMVSSKVVDCAEAPSRARKLVRYGDVLASTVRPEQKKVGIVTNALDDNAICTTGFAVIRPFRIQPYLLFQLLRTEFVTAQLMRNNIGVAYPTVEESCFSEIVLPITISQIESLNTKAEQIVKMQIELSCEQENFVAGMDKEVDEWIKTA